MCLDGLLFLVRVGWLPPGLLEVVQQIGSNITSSLGLVGDSTVLDAFPMGTEKGEINLTTVSKDASATGFLA